MPPTSKRQRETATRTGLFCAKCNQTRFRVIYTRPRPDGQIIRRRECRACGTRITTLERAVG